MCRWLVLWLLLCGLPAQAGVEFWQQPAFIQRAFVAVALRNEYKPGADRLRRWQQPVRIWLDHRVGDQSLHRDLVLMHLRHLQQITGHPLSLVERAAEANVRLVFTRQAVWREQVAELLGPSAVQTVQGAVCLAGFQTRPSGEIISASVVIPVDQARMHGRLAACIVEELTQIMGLPNDADEAYPSIFNDKSPEQVLSPLDVVLLQLLYQPQLRPGMTEAQLTPLLEKLLNNWLADGTIANAVALAGAGELNALLLH